MNSKKIAFNLALGSACVISLGAFPVVQASENPFRMSALPGGYLLADASDTHVASKKTNLVKCDEAKSGDQKDTKTADDKCNQESRSSESSKLKSGWCGDGGRCGYKTRE